MAETSASDTVEHNKAVTARLFERILGAVGWVGLVGVLVLMAHTVLNAVLRKTAIGSLYGTLEFGGYWYMAIIAMLGLIWAQQRGEHIDARLIFDFFPRAVQREVEIFNHLITFLICVGFTIYGWVEAVDKMDIGTTAGVSGVVIWPAYFFVPLGFGLMAIQVALDSGRLFKNQTPSTDSEATHVSA